jgi:hypothetical protein
VRKELSGQTFHPKSNVDRAINAEASRKKGLADGDTRTRVPSAVLTFC